MGDIRRSGLRPNSRIRSVDRANVGLNDYFLKMIFTTGGREATGILNSAP